LPAGKHHGPTSRMSSNHLPPPWPVRAAANGYAGLLGCKASVFTTELKRYHNSSWLYPPRDEEPDHGRKAIMPRRKAKQQPRREVDAETKVPAAAGPDPPDPRFDNAGSLFGEADLAPVLQIASILGRAYLHCVASGLRFGYKATRTVMQGEARLLTPFRRAGAAEEMPGLREIVDEARGSLRRISDAASQEFRHLQTEFTVLQEEIRSVIDATDYPEGDHIRRWKSKP